MTQNAGLRDRLKCRANRAKVDRSANMIHRSGVAHTVWLGWRKAVIAGISRTRYPNLSRNICRDHRVDCAGVGETVNVDFLGFVCGVGYLT